VTVHQGGAPVNADPADGKAFPLVADALSTTAGLLDVHDALAEGGAGMPAGGVTISR
jgi:hypothetical protein